MPPLIQLLTDMFTPGRCMPVQPVRAVVLHEFDGSLETLDAAHRTCSPLRKRCHSSFHYGVAATDCCTVHQYVLEQNQSWTFDCSPLVCEPCPPNCPPCPPDDPCRCCLPLDHPLLVAFPGVDPNCYTINIAIPTGVTTVGGPCPTLRNNYPCGQLECLARLVCSILRRHNLPFTPQTVFSHCDELIDFPWADFMDMVGECLVAPPAPCRPSGLVDCNGNTICYGSAVVTCGTLGPQLCDGLVALPPVVDVATLLNAQIPYTLPDGTCGKASFCQFMNSLPSVPIPV